MNPAVPNAALCSTVPNALGFVSRRVRMLEMQQGFLQSRECAWVPALEGCARRGRFMHGQLVNASSCGDPCKTYRDCEACVSEPELRCAWCADVRRCFPFSAFKLLFPMGRCKHWIRSGSSVEACTSCAEKRSCKDCLSEFECGWCSVESANPLEGFCLAGTWTGGFCPANTVRVASFCFS